MPIQPARARRRGAAVLLLLAVLIGHWLLGAQVSDQLVGWGAGDRPTVQRMDVAFVRTLVPAQPPAAAPRPPPVAAQPAAQAASAVKPAASAPPERAVAVREPAAASAVDDAVVTSAPPEPAPTSDPVEPPIAEAPPAVPAAASEAVPVDIAASAPAAQTAAAPASDATADGFEWPPSTRLRYVLTGQYRGEVHGAAQVQWVRRGSRYQVHLDVTVGPSFAPLLARRATSDGELTERGLAPRIYDEETKTLFGSPRRAVVRFEPDRIVLTNGRVRPTMAGVQDTASQFVQLTWLFTRHPEQLRVGNSVSQPLALPRRVDPWVYDIIEEQSLTTPVGPLQTFHVRPRRESVKPGELVAEMWIAPALQYLPVRIRIVQDDQNYIDLMLDSAPLQAEPR